MIRRKRQHKIPEGAGWLRDLADPGSSAWPWAEQGPRADVPERAAHVKPSASQTYLPHIASCQHRYSHQHRASASSLLCPTLPPFVPAARAVALVDSWGRAYLEALLAGEADAIFTQKRRSLMLWSVPECHKEARDYRGLGYLRRRKTMAVLEPHYSKEEFAQRGQTIYV
jgi:hypothetical protein